MSRHIHSSRRSTMRAERKPSPDPLRMNRRSLVGGATAATFGMAAMGSRAAHAQGTPASLALDWYPNANHAGIYLARDRGAFVDAGIDLDIVVPSDPTTVLHTVGAGRDTFGISYHSEVLFAREQGVPVVSIAAVVQHPLNSLLVLTESGIESPADLAGKSVAVTGVPADEVFLASILESVDLSIDDVEIINVGWDLMPAVLSGRADSTIGVYWTHETILAEREGYDITYFRIEEWGVPDHYELVLVASESTIESDPDLVSGFLSVLQEGFHDAIDEPDVALQSLLDEGSDLIPEVEELGIELLTPLWTSDESVAWGTQTDDRWDDFASWLVEGELLSEDLDVDAAWTSDFLPETS